VTSSKGGGERKKLPSERKEFKEKGGRKGKNLRSSQLVLRNKGRKASKFTLKNRKIKIF